MASESTSGEDSSTNGSMPMKEVPMSAPRAIAVRAAAVFYDLLLLIAVWFIVTAAALWFNDGEAIVHPLYDVAMLGVAWLFFDWFWRHGGQTLGMKAWRLRLVDASGRPPSSRHCIHRFVCGSLLFGVSWIASLFTRDGLPLHDRLSRTRLVRVSKAMTRG